MRVLSLFAGVGGFDLGFQRAGMETVAFVEVDPFCRSVLHKHWPDVPQFGDVRDVGAHNLPDFDVICGGFPCQNISRAGRREGIDGRHSGLWGQFARIICETRPRWVVVENSPSLTVRGLDRILRDMAEIGYDAEWDCLPAAAFGAPHIRDRIYLVAYPGGVGHGPPPEALRPRGPISQLHGGWTPEPSVGRVANGISDRVDRVRALGNAQVPQVAEWIGRRIMEAE